MTDIFAGLICRPPRKQYTVEELGPSRYLLHEQMCIRRDLELRNRMKMKLFCSHYLPVNTDSLKVDVPVPCVVYLHGNSGSRMDADDLVDFYLEHNISVFSVDFSGCGQSEGEYVTLGHREKEDLQTVLDYLAELPYISHVGLYGRSMGAATALLVAADDKYYHRIRGMVLDSCYTSVRQVLQELAKKYVGKVPLVPFASMVNGAVDMLREAVITKACFDIDEVDVLGAAKHCCSPVLFGHAKDDQLVLAAHTTILFEHYGGEKEINVFEGDHNSIRPKEFRSQALQFLRKCFEEDSERDARAPPPTPVRPASQPDAPRSPPPAHKTAEMGDAGQAAAAGGGEEAVGRGASAPAPLVGMSSWA
ncbi:Alpha/Beta hydrolase protein, partial [Baffinella frigidus]